jgi:hypothetical protein
LGFLVQEAPDAARTLTAIKLPARMRDQWNKTITL